MKSTKKLISILIAVMMLMSCVSAAFTTVNASTNKLCDVYSTNPDGKVGVKKTITIDGDCSDWSSDMLIAQGAAWDVANHYKGGHENCVLDTYALFAAWDDDNLYVGWQMVNTTDTWARSGDGPLSDGGRVLDVPLILALSVDPVSTSMSNKNTDGGPIWGHKMGLEFNQHVDHLFYMSGKPGLGTPAMFTAVDSEGNTNYTDGCLTFKDGGIEYKMAEDNVCDSIIGLNSSDDPSDVYSNDADWVDYKTFEGQSGTHDTKYDSFYEMKIPLSVLGIDANYLENNGIGAMLVATRGESGLDCIPFDDTMLDNASGSYASDPSTSAEKDDVDVITSEFAKIGNAVSVPTTPTQPITQPTTQPTTKPTQPTQTTAPATNLKVNTTSNLFSSSTKTAEKGDRITVSFKLQSSMNVLNSQWMLSYDASKLKLVSKVDTSMTPALNGSLVNQPQAGTIKGNSTSTTLSDFTTSKDFLTMTFDVVGTGTTTVDLNVEVLGVAYKVGSDIIEAYPVDNGIVNDITGETGFNNFTYSATSYIADTNPTTEPTTEPTQPTQPTTEPTDPTQPTTPPTDQLTVNAKSNFFTSTTKTFDENTDTVTVYYKLNSNKAMAKAHWTLTYDTSKLTLLNADMACVSNEKITNPREGAINCLYTNSDPVTFSTEKSFIIAKFKVKDLGAANVSLTVNSFAINSDNTSSAETVYLLQNGVVNDVTSIAGFEDTEYSTRVAFASTQSTTPPVEDDITVNAKSNFFTTASTTVDKDTDTVTVYYKLKSSKEMAKSHWTMIYDTSKLTLINADMACVSGEKITNPREGAINCLYTNSDPVTFSSEKTFVVAKFKIKGTGQANVSLTVNSLAINSDNTSSADTTYLVQNGVVNDVTSIAGFEDTEYSTRIAFASSK